MEYNRNVFILSADKQEIDLLCSMLSEEAYGSKAFHGMEELKAGLRHHGCLAVILDIDSVSLSNRLIRILKDSFPDVSIFFTSRRRFHPELQDSLSHHICACLSKPVDPDELHFWLKSVSDNDRDYLVPP